MRWHSPLTDTASQWLVFSSNPNRYLRLAVAGQQRVFAHAGRCVVVESLESELDRARSLSVDDLADAIESIGFECTRCGACCTASSCDSEDVSQDNESTEPHTATVFPDEIREIQQSERDEWRDIARPMPYGLSPDTGEGETFEWALQTDACGDCTFYEEPTDGTGGCTIYDNRPLICHTYPFSVALGGTTQPMGEPVDSKGLVRAHECEGLGRDIDHEAAKELAATLKKRAIRELEEAVGVRDTYEPVQDEPVIVYDSEGAKRPDGSNIETE